MVSVGFIVNKEEKMELRGDQERIRAPRDTNENGDHQTNTVAAFRLCLLNKTELIEGSHAIVQTDLFRDLSP